MKNRTELKSNLKRNNNILITLVSILIIIIIIQTILICTKKQSSSTKTVIDSNSDLIIKINKKDVKKSNLIEKLTEIDELTKERLEEKHYSNLCENIEEICLLIEEYKKQLDNVGSIADRFTESSANLSKNDLKVIKAVFASINYLSESSIVLDKISDIINDYNLNKKEKEKVLIVLYNKVINNVYQNILLFIESNGKLKNKEKVEVLEKPFYKIGIKFGKVTKILFVKIKNNIIEEYSLPNKVYTIEDTKTLQISLIFPSFFFLVNLLNNEQKQINDLFKYESIVQAVKVSETEGFKSILEATEEKVLNFCESIIESDELNMTELNNLNKLILKFMEILIKRFE